MRARFLAFCFLLIGVLATTSEKARAEGPVVNVEVYGSVGELPLGKLVFQGTGFDSGGTQRTINASGARLGVTSGTFIAAGMIFRAAPLQTRFGSLMLGIDFAGGSGGVSTVPGSLGYTPDSISMLRASLDISWTFTARALLLSYGASFGGRAVFLDLSNLYATSDTTGANAQVVCDHGYAAVWFRPSFAIARYTDASLYVGGALTIDPFDPGFREYGVTVGGMVW